ncbi:hypothetical protein NBRC110019_09410 [Neptunitalea chrysea]|uniref:DUF6787 domain-containing protein n=1 Tax=Neptunitalea chrysea TaxID=1647581 RepID=A0A9W6B4V8_9FLAO|nr:DUF6787 family protein [Neptunitalea chrysea]GLB51902.1 hypothetical protein NBRC110019_09410 [Neptunitalea chrysea]
MGSLKERWNVKSNLQFTLILIVFAITGSTSAYIIRPIFSSIGFTRNILGVEWYWGIVYFIIEIIAILPIYFPLLLFVGTVFGQFKFFWNFEKKMLSRIGFSSLKKN